ncbi:Calcineurin-like_phosphoesterase domain-containing protein [Hexamita inflata]|uniref:Calcineurin-like_phosphoesterase domain-containing protein n=1 Tax=Hexamita inflata TaxID=28002 RepID=A0ABP1HMD4_9EUKA
MLFLSVALLIIFVVSIWQFSSTGYLLNNAIVSGSAFILLQVSTLVIIFIQSKLSVKAFKLSIITFITVFAGFSLGTFISLIVSFSLGIVYGPISFIHEDKARIHWATRTGQYFRSRLYNTSNFTYNFNNRQYTNSLPSKTSKFIVMADINLNNHYTSTMSADYDFALFCGDYSFHGKLQEYSLAFNKMPTKPLLMAVGNHDDRRNFSLVNGRSKNFFQKVNQIGFISFTFKSQIRQQIQKLTTGFSSQLIIRIWEWSVNITSLSSTSPFTPQETLARINTSANESNN